MYIKKYYFCCVNLSQPNGGRDKTPEIINKMSKKAENLQNAETQALNIHVVPNRSFSVDEVKFLLEKQKKACACEFIHAEMTMDKPSDVFMNKYIDYIEKMKQDENVDRETYIVLIKGFKIKLETWLMERPRFSDDPDFIEMTTAIKYISDEVSLNCS